MWRPGAVTVSSPFAGSGGGGVDSVDIPIVGTREASAKPWRAWMLLVKQGAHDAEIPTMSTEPAGRSDAFVLMLRMYVPVMLFRCCCRRQPGALIVLIAGSWLACVVPVMFVMISGVHLLYLFWSPQEDQAGKRLVRNEASGAKVKLREFVIDIGK